MFKSEISGNYWTWGTSTWSFTSKETSGGNTFYVYGTGLSALAYNPDTGLLTNTYGQTRCQCGTGLDPLAGDDISPIDGTTDYKFTKLASTWPSVPSDLFARISDIAAFSTTKSYVIGDIAGYGGRVYKCTVAHTGEWDALHFTAATKLEMQAYLTERDMLTFSPWCCIPAELTDPLTSQKLSVEVRYEDNTWELLVVGGSGEPLATVTPGDPDARSLEFNFVWDNKPTTVAAMRAYQLGNQSDKLLQPAGDYATNTDVMHKTGNETIGGDKTFTGGNTVIPFITAGQGAIKIGISGRISQVTAGGLLDDTYVPNYGEVKSAIPYTLVTKTISNNVVTLNDRACNYVDARSLGSSDSLDIDFPALVDDKGRDFMLAVECGANPPTISYAALVTIMAEDASSIIPEEGMNIYSFKEFKTNMFIASRKLVVTVVNNSSENS